MDGPNIEQRCVRCGSLLKPLMCQHCRAVILPERCAQCGTPYDAKTNPPNPHFPKWKYHKTKPGRQVDNPDEEAALGAGWQDKPFPPDPQKDNDEDDGKHPEPHPAHHPPPLAETTIAPVKPKGK